MNGIDGRCMQQRMQHELLHMDRSSSGAIRDSRFAYSGGICSQTSTESISAAPLQLLQRQQSSGSCTSSTGDSTCCCSAAAEAPSRSGSLLLQVDQANNISSKGFKEIASAIGSLRHLQHLRLDWNPIGSDGDSSNTSAVQLLCDSIYGLKALESLSLVHCQLGHRAADAISGLILQNSKSLREIHLRNNAMGEEGCAQLAAAMKMNRCLTTLDLTGNGARPSTLCEVSKCCADNSKLLHLLPLQQQEITGLHHSNKQQHQKQQQQADDYVARIEAELKSTEQGSLEERYKELYESRLLAQQQKLQLQQQQQQLEQQQQQQALLQRQIHDRQDTNEKLLSDLQCCANFCSSIRLQQRELQLQQKELLLQQQQQDTARLQAELEQQQNAADRRQQMLQQEVDRLQQQQRQLQKQLLEEKDKHMKQQDGTLQQHQQLQQQQHQQQQRILELQQELQQEAQRRLQGEKEALEEKQNITANLTKTQQQVGELKQRLEERRETEELQLQQQQQLEQRIAELQQEAAAAATAAEQMQTKIRQLATKAAAAEAEQQRQRDLLNARQKALEQLQQQVKDEQQNHLKAQELLKSTAAQAAAKADEQLQQAQQQLQQREQQQQQQQQQLQFAQAEAAKHEGNLKALREAHAQLKDELRKSQSECQRAQEEGRLAAARQQRQQREWQSQREDLCMRLYSSIELLQGVLTAAKQQEMEMQAI
ncbi:myosin heavy chain, putative [Eimeria maxima]|uniref:Myosin heavy chain, putative n=1 Tax=Eimeria maxima TaxID=5804 RepID=U6MBM5_EIMMA|nr:myosin heavy chain, putative [Eimeria maxima]CDJ61602.1 myosin heavy chain, putative [Eimeria maxima]